MNKKFKTLLYKKGLTQSALADGVGVSKQAISMWVNGTSRPATSLLPRIAAFLEMSIEEIAEYFI